MQRTHPPLALRGGPRVCTAQPVWPPADDEVCNALQRAFADGSWGRYHGLYGPSLCERLASWMGLPFVTLCSSGTIAVELALRGVGVAAGDEVILAGYDFPGNFRALEAIGARPVLVDVDSANWNLDGAQVEAAVSTTTKAILASHLHGGLVPMQQLMPLAASHGLAVVEDACQCPGATVQGRLAGTWGDATVLSFGGSKLLTAGRGGAVLTASDAVQQRMRLFNDRGNQAFPLSELQAAVVLPQLDMLAQRNLRRTAAVKRLTQGIADIDLLRPLANSVPGEPAYYKWGLQFDGSHSSRHDFIAAAQAEGVPLDAGFPGFALRSSRRCRAAGPLTQSRRAAEQMIVLHHPILLEPDEVLDSIIEALHKVAWHVRRGAL